MAASVDADIIAHFDRIMWRGVLLGTPLAPRHIESIIRDALATVARHNCALELNTRYLRSEPNWRKELLQMLHWLREEGGTRVVINSDAHRNVAARSELRYGQKDVGYSRPETGGWHPNNRDCPQRPVMAFIFELAGPVCRAAVLMSEYHRHDPRRHL